MKKRTQRITIYEKYWQTLFTSDLTRFNSELKNALQAQLIHRHCIHKSSILSFYISSQ
jgi:hypothetical protein